MNTETIEPASGRMRILYLTTCSKALRQKADQYVSEQNREEVTLKRLETYWRCRSVPDCAKHDGSFIVRS